MTDDEIRKLWREAGGDFHGPKIETGCMAEAKLLPFLRSLTPRWIPVTERKPTHNYSVLGYIVKGGLTLDEPFRDIVSYLPERDVWLQFVGDEGDEEVIVTHWMDLPDPPKRYWPGGGLSIDEADFSHL